ncbi:dienelactone hydrolase family protein [Nonomuraea dietziae]|uniref:dienelactone hydrolase family protein n=1 Tax=Nonomuraea dietziae TaxID=65515 RepID=UPI0034463ED2
MRQQVRIPLPDGGALAATMALPEGAAPVAGWPGVVVVHEIYGVEPDILDVVDLFAEHGYAAVLPDLYSHGTRAGCLARVRPRPPGSGRRVAAHLRLLDEHVANRG